MNEIRKQVGKQEATGKKIRYSLTSLNYKQGKYGTVSNHRKGKMIQRSTVHRKPYFRLTH